MRPGVAGPTSHGVDATAPLLPTTGAQAQPRRRCRRGRSALPPPLYYFVPDIWAQTQASHMPHVWLRVLYST